VSVQLADLRRNERERKGCAESGHEPGTTALPLSALRGSYVRRNNPWAEPIHGKVSHPLNARALRATRMS